MVSDIVTSVSAIVVTWHNVSVRVLLFCVVLSSVGQYPVILEIIHVCFILLTEKILNKMALYEKFCTFLVSNI